MTLFVFANRVLKFVWAFAFFVVTAASCFADDLAKTSYIGKGSYADTPYDIIWYEAKVKPWCQDTVVVGYRVSKKGYWQNNGLTNAFFNERFVPPILDIIKGTCPTAKTLKIRFLEPPNNHVFDGIVVNVSKQSTYFTKEAVEQRIADEYKNMGLEPPPEVSKPGGILDTLPSDFSPFDKLSEFWDSLSADDTLLLNLLTALIFWTIIGNLLASLVFENSPMGTAISIFLSLLTISFLEHYEIIYGVAGNSMNLLILIWSVIAAKNRLHLKILAGLYCGVSAVYTHFLMEALHGQIDIFVEKMKSFF
jgi:hypothetical protein